jgi:predicted metal-dependent HD superfamily phosphohydrolase
MELLERWTAAAERIGAQHDVGVEGTRLIAAYGSSTRRYHDVEHLTVVLDHVEDLALFARDPDVVRVAAWFHDAAYDPDRDDNELVSAALAATVLDRLDVEDHVTDEVVRLVRLTATHDPLPDDRDGHVLCDADLAVLGGPSEAYARYAAAIRAEYAHVEDAMFAAARSAVLGRLLERPRLYCTPAGRSRWEDAARRNVSRELEFLAASGGATPPR